MKKTVFTLLAMSLLGSCQMSSPPAAQAPNVSQVRLNSATLIDLGEASGATLHGTISMNGFAPGFNLKSCTAAGTAASVTQVAIDLVCDAGACTPGNVTTGNVNIAGGTGTYTIKGLKSASTYHVNVTSVTPAQGFNNTAPNSRSSDIVLNAGGAFTSAPDAANITVPLTDPQGGQCTGQITVQDGPATGEEID